MKENFTPGVWSYNQWSGFIDAEFNGHSEVVCEVYGNNNSDGYLLTAAPEMYDCICDALTDLQMSAGMRAHFEEVLKKARGEA